MLYIFILIPGFFLTMQVILNIEIKTKRLSLHEICNNIAEKFILLCYFIVSSPISFTICTLSALLISKLIKINAIGYMHNSTIISYIFITFSLIVPSIFLFRIIFYVIIDIITLHNNINLLAIIIGQIANARHYKINDISPHFIVNIFTFSVFGIFILDVIEFSYYLEWKSLNNLNNVSITNKYLVWSYEDISIPSNSYTNHVLLNQTKGKSYDVLCKDKYTPIPTPSGGNPLMDYQLNKGNTTFVRISNGLYFEKSYLKGRFTDSINSLTSIPVNYNFNFNLNIRGSYTENTGLNCKFSELYDNPGSETHVDALTATLCCHFFKYDDCYTYNPQSNDSELRSTRSGRIDFMVKYLRNPVLIIENKHATGESWLDSIIQARRYCGNNDSNETVFVLIFRGSKMSAFLYDQDWHTNHRFHLKNPDFQDILGLEVNSSGVGLTTQVNTFHPQLKIYESGPRGSNSDRLAVSSIFSYISGFTDLTHKEVKDDFSLPSNGRPPKIVGTSWYQDNVYKRLHIGANGKFIHL